MKRIFLNQAIIILGSALVAIGVNVFLVPANISSGGITGVATILLRLFGVRISIVNLILNGVLLLVGLKITTKPIIFRTLVGIVYLSVFFEITAYLPAYEGNVFVNTTLGGVFTGCGVGVIIRSHASSGGSDFAALLLKKRFPHISVPTLIMIIDGVVILTSGVVFASFEVTVFSFLTLFIATKVADYIMIIGDKAKVLNIVSKKATEVSEVVIKDHKRGITGIYAKGMYLRKDFLFLYCVVSPRELPILLGTIKSIDSEAFVVISDAREVWGEGFKSSSFM